MNMDLIQVHLREVGTRLEAMKDESLIEAATRVVRERDALKEEVERLREAIDAPADRVLSLRKAIEEAREILWAKDTESIVDVAQRMVQEREERENERREAHLVVRLALETTTQSWRTADTEVAYAWAALREEPIPDKSRDGVPRLGAAIRDKLKTCLCRACHELRQLAEDPKETT
jgi:chromosome segregation ATPase